MDIETIRSLLKDPFQMTQHAEMRRRQRGITIPEIKRAILNGEIIEDYPDDYPFPSCLILGYAAENAPLHLVCGDCIPSRPSKMGVRLENEKGEVTMTCFFCKGDLLPDRTTHMMELKTCILIVKNVPCNRCSQCGEVTLSSDVIEQLDALAARFDGALTEVAVVNYTLKSA